MPDICQYCGADINSDTPAWRDFLPGDCPAQGTDNAKCTEPFKTGGSLKGAPHDGAWFWGRLDYTYRASVNAAAYVITSYQTPIAWRAADGTWYMPSVKYSVTTTKHQTTVRHAFRELGVNFSAEIPANN